MLRSARYACARYARHPRRVASLRTRAARVLESSLVSVELNKAQLDDQASWSTRSWTALQGQRLSLAIQFAVAYEIINELGYGDGAATTAARGAAAEAEVNVDEGTGEDDAAWAAGEGDGLGGREGA